MARRTFVNIEITETDRDGLGLLAAQQGVSASELVRNAVKHLDAPTVAQVVVTALASPVPEKATKTVPTSMYLDPSDVTILDTMAKKLVSTRNAFVKLIIKGILSGVVR